MRFVVAVVLCGMVSAVVAQAPNGESLPCAEREFGKGERVCVCNATYCDTIHPLPPFPSRTFITYTSDRDGSRFAFARKNLVGRINPKSIKVMVNSSEKYQTILGFGGALSDAAAANIKSLSEKCRDKLLKSYFSETGVEYNLVRIPIGGTDHSERPHSLDDTRGDTALDHFALSHEDVHFKIPQLRKIKETSRRSVRLMATAWTAPPWMKTNDDYKGVGVLKDEYLSLWSQYHLRYQVSMVDAILSRRGWSRRSLDDLATDGGPVRRFMAEYEKHGLSFWAITTGYRPSTGLIPFYPHNCMGWTPFSQSQWLSEHLGPDLLQSPYNETKIIILDDLRFFLPWWPKIMFYNEKTRRYASGIGVQWYWDFILPHRLLDLTHAEFPEKFILGTEASFDKWRGSSTPVALGSWNRAEEYAESAINDLNHWMAGWMDSNLVLDLRGGPSWVKNFADAAVIANATGDEFLKQPMYYVMGHFSKFIPEGSVRIGVKVSAPGLMATALRTPQGNVVVVLLNKKTHRVPITILGPKKGNANFSLPKKSIATIIYRDKRKLPTSTVSF